MPFLGMRFDSSLKNKNPNQHVHISISYLQSLPRMPPGRAMGYIQRSTVHRSGSIPDDRQINHDTYKLSAERLSLLHTGISMVLSKLNHDQMANNIFRSLCQNGEHKNKQNGHTAVFWYLLRMQTRAIRSLSNAICISTCGNARITVLCLIAE